MIEESLSELERSLDFEDEQQLNQEEIAPDLPRSFFLGPHFQLFKEK